MLCSNRIKSLVHYEQFSSSDKIIIRGGSKYMATEISANMHMIVKNSESCVPGYASKESRNNIQNKH